MNFIDRTIPELFKDGKRRSRLDLIDFCFLLKKVGVRKVEVHREIVKKLEHLPKGISFLYRMIDFQDAEIIQKHALTDILIEMNMLMSDWMNDSMKRYLRESSFNITVEICIESIKSFVQLYEILPVLKSLNVKTIRLTGMDNFVDDSWLAIVKGFHDSTGITFDVCPGNRWNTAVGTLIEAALAGVSFGTGTYLGYGYQNVLFAPLEEVLVAGYVIMQKNRDTTKDAMNEKAQNSSENLNLFNCMPELNERFQSFIRKTIPLNKPVLGKNLFHYESGIHADGIEKNPETYEPYDPRLVGLKRCLVIGKHSGRKSLSSKLTELNLNPGAISLGKLLETVRQKSCDLGRSLSDSELYTLVRNS
jgi:homocitrate synthase NifV